MRSVSPFAAPAAALRCELQVACARGTTPRMFRPLGEQVCHATIASAALSSVCSCSARADDTVLRHHDDAHACAGGMVPPSLSDPVGPASLQNAGHCMHNDLTVVCRPVAQPQSQPCSDRLLSCLQQTLQPAQKSGCRRDASLGWRWHGMPWSGDACACVYTAAASHVVRSLHECTASCRTTCCCEAV